MRHRSRSRRPTEDELTAYLAANAKTYEAPEYRSITLLMLAPEDLVDEIEVSDADLKRRVRRAERGSYRKPEQRQFEQLLAPDEATIRRAAQAVAGGQTFTQAATALKDARVERSEVGPLAKGDLPEALDQAGFGAGPGRRERAGARRRSAGICCARSRWSPEQVQPLSAVEGRDAPRAGLERRPASCRTARPSLDDELAAGTPLEAAAEKQGIAPLKLERIDHTGHTPAQERLAADRLTSDILERVFTAAQGETSLLEQTADGRYFMFRVDAVEPARERPLADVRDEVAAAWRAEEQQKRAKARAEELRAQVERPAALAPGRPGPPRYAAGRGGAGGARRRRGEARAWRSRDRRAVRDRLGRGRGRRGRGGRWLGDRGGRRGAAGNGRAAGPERHPDRASPNSLRSELLGAYEAALRQRYSVSINQAVLAQLMEQKSQ